MSIKREGGLLEMSDEPEILSRYTTFLILTGHHNVSICMTEQY